MKLRQTLAGVATTVSVLLAANAAAAPTELNQLYDPYYGGHVKHEGYLEFINPTEYPQFYPQGIPLPSTPPGVIMTEEYTGYTQSSGQDVIEIGDSDTTAGDRADFDWVQENRLCETGNQQNNPNCNNRLPVNHTIVDNQGQTVGLVGSMGWTVGSTEASPHIDPGNGPHNDGQNGQTHSDEQTPQGPLPHLVNGDYQRQFFNAVDVFSIISIGQDEGVNVNDPASLRAAALDYVLDFGNSVTGAFSPGVLSVIWIPGWTPLTYIDDYVARWVPQNPGIYNLVAIEPPLNVGDQRVEIDAIKALDIPEPATLALMGLGLAGLGLARRRSR